MSLSKQTKSILHVDDSLTVQEGLRNYLKRVGGYDDIRQVTTLDDAVGAVKQRPYDIYIVDGAFPERNGMPSEEGIGLRFHDELVRMGIDPYFILLTLDDSMEGEAKTRGVHYINKNGPLERLLALLK